MFILSLEINIKNLVCIMIPPVLVGSFYKYGYELDSRISTEYMELIIFTLLFLPLALSFCIGILVGRILELNKKL